MFRSSLRVALLAFASLAIIGLAGCVDDPTELEGEAAAGARCSSVIVDETEPAVAQTLEGATWEPIGAPTVDRVDGKRVSRAFFHVTTASGDLDAKLPVKVECTSTCSGSTCTNNGCDASATGCSTFSCSGMGCTGGCTKKSTFTPDP